MYVESINVTPPHLEIFRATRDRLEAIVLISIYVHMCNGAIAQLNRYENIDGSWNIKHQFFKAKVYRKDYL